MQGCCDLSTPETHYLQEVLQARTEGNRNLEIQRISAALKEGSCPMFLRKIVEAQHSSEGIALGQPDGQSIKIKLLFADTLGFAFTLGARVVRVAATTALMPLSLPYSMGKQYRYDIDGEFTDHLCRYGEEWVDLAVTLGLLPVGVLNFIWTGVGSDSMKSLSDYYVERIDNRNSRDHFVDEKIKQFLTMQQRIRQAWDAQQPPPQALQEFTSVIVSDEEAHPGGHSSEPSKNKQPADEDSPLLKNRGRNSRGYAG
jgi:hypothetical protein